MTEIKQPCYVHEDTEGIRECDHWECGLGEGWRWCRFGEIEKLHRERIAELEADKARLQCERRTIGQMFAFRCCIWGKKAVYCCSSQS